MKGSYTTVVKDENGKGWSAVYCKYVNGNFIRTNNTPKYFHYDAVQEARTIALHNKAIYVG